MRVHSRNSACRALSFARAVRATLKAKQDSASMHINEIEEYLGILREEKAFIDMQMVEAEEQVGMVREVLDSEGIPEVSLSDDEGPSPPSSPLASSVSMLISGDSEGSDPIPPILYAHGRHSNPDSGSSSLSNYTGSRQVKAFSGSAG
jgi:hypothetical protein